MATMCGAFYLQSRASEFCPSIWRGTLHPCARWRRVAKAQSRRHRSVTVGPACARAATDCIARLWQQSSPSAAFHQASRPVAIGWVIRDG